MPVEIKDVLTKLGATEEQIQKIESGELQVDEVFNAYETAKIEKAKELVKNDEEFRSSLTASEVNKIIGTLDNDIKKRFGLNPKDLEGKKLHEKLDMIAEATKKASGGSSKDLEEVQQKLQDALTKVTQYENELIPAKEREFQTREQRWHADLQFGKAWDGVSPDKILVPKESARVIVEQYINNNYDARVVDGSLQYFNKGKETHPVIGNEVVKTADVLITKVIETLKINKAHNGGAQGGAPAGGQRRDPIDPKKARTYSPDGVSAAEKRLQEMQKFV